MVSPVPAWVNPSQWPKEASWWSGPWWAMLLKGIFALVFGLYALTFPGITLFVLAMLFGTFALVDGTFTIVITARHREGHKHWKWSMSAGIAGTIIGSIVLYLPHISLSSLLYFIGAWAIVIGTLSIINATRLHRKIKIAWPLGAGLISLGFGIAIIVFPSESTLVFMFIVGIYGVVYGIPVIGKAVNMWREQRRLKAENTG